MQKFLYLILFFGIISVSYSQQGAEGRIRIERSESYIKIPVSDVMIAKQPLKEEAFGDAIQKLSLGDIEAYSPTESGKMLVPTRLHPFVAALHYSFAQHRPIVISPDMVWLMILQGFAKHVKYNADSLQDELVGFSGKRKLSVRRDDFIKGDIRNDWEQVFKAFSDSIAEDTGPELNDMMINRFTTTTEKELAAYRIVMMDAMSEYYVYHVMTACGIPYVILEGEPGDWFRIKEELPKFRKYGLDFWIDNLQPVVDEFYESSSGNVDTLFWKSIYKWGSVSGGNIVTGWIVKFFPYLNNDSDRKIINEFLNTKMIINPTRKYRPKRGMYGDDFPSALSSCDFEWEFRTPALDTTFDMKFCAGFIGITQDENLALRPEINWFVSEKRPPLNMDLDDTEKIQEYLLSKDYELDMIGPGDPDNDILYYDYCENPDVYPVFNPDINDTFDIGWADFLSYIEENDKLYIDESWGFKDIKLGKAEIEFVVSPDGIPVIVNINTNSTISEMYSYSFFRDMPKWKPAQKNGEYAMVKMKVEIDFKEAAGE